MTDLHTHKCGLEPRPGKVTGQGCGHEWEHDGDALKDPDKAHFCPRCGAGPWTFRHRDRSGDVLVEFLEKLIAGRLRL